MVEERGGSVARAMRKLGYPTRQTPCQWPNRRDASRERRAGRPWSRYGPALKAQAVAFVRSGTAGKDVAETWSGKEKLDFLLRILKRIVARIPLETCSPRWNACAPYCNRALCT